MPAERALQALHEGYSCMHIKGIGAGSITQGTKLKGIHLDHLKNH